MRQRAARGAVLGSLVAGLAGGCGGDTPTREQYVSALNAMCADFSAREQEIGEPQSISDLVEIGPRVLDAFEQAIVDKVSVLEAPGEIAGEAERLASLARRQRDVLMELIDAARAGDAMRVRELVSTNQAVNKEANSIAGELGAEACAEG